MLPLKPGAMRDVRRVPQRAPRTQENSAAIERHRELGGVLEKGDLDVRDQLRRGVVGRRDGGRGGSALFERLPARSVAGGELLFGCPRNVLGQLVEAFLLFKGRPTAGADRSCYAPT